MGRRKIEIKAIRDDRNRSVTFLKRKGGLFKKAHELSVLCSVDVAVFIFGNNKKLYEYSSADMQHLITKYQYHGGPNEHKGPADFNGGGNDDDDDEDGDGTPPRPDGMEAHMMPPHFQGQPQSFPPHIRHQTASVSPPIPNGMPFQGHPAHLQRSHTPQPAVPSRPGSRGDMRRMGPGMMSQPVGPHGPHPGITYMPTPPIYNPAAGTHSNLMPPQPGPYPFQPPQQQQQQQQQPYMEERRPSAPPTFNAHPPPQPMAAGPRPEPSPPQPPHQLVPPHSIPPHMTSPQPSRRPLDPQPPPPVEPKPKAPGRPIERPKAPLINTDIAIKKISQRKSHSIFTPIEESRSILSQHLASFASEPQSQSNANRSQSADNGPIIRNGESSSSPHLQQRSNLRNTSISSLPDTPNTSSLKINTAVGGARPKPPRLTVQIPDGASEAGGSATGDSNSPRNPADAVSHAQHRHGTVVLPPPSPSATALHSAGATTGPPNPFARPVPQQNINGDTPVSALPSRFLNNELLPSPSSFYPEWNFRGSDNNTLPSPLNFTTPVVGSGPSFLRDDSHMQGGGGGGNAEAGNGNLGASTQPSGLVKRKSPGLEATGPDENHDMASDPKRLKVDR